MTGGRSLPLTIQPQSPGLSERIWLGSGTRTSARWTGEQGINLMSSNLLTEDTCVPFDKLQTEQIAIFRQAWKEAGWQHEPHVSVCHSVLPIVNDLDEALFGRERDSTDQIGTRPEPGSQQARFGKTYADEPDVTAEQLARDAAVREVDTLLITAPNTLDADYNVHLLTAVVEYIAPAIGWQRTA